MHTLLITHVHGSDPAAFEVRRPEGRATGPKVVPSPVGFPVEGRPGSDLLRELRWYLEQFLDYPFSPELEHSERVLAALHAWGEQAFNALFDNRAGTELLSGAKAKGYNELRLQIRGDDPAVLAWPWEALRDPQASMLAATCQIERCLNHVGDPVPLPAGLPQDRVSILLVTARPLEGDVRYRSISRPLVELIEKQNLPARVHVLRPPTFERLREHLRERPGYYHIVHFDGHGSFGTGGQAPAAPYTFRARQGHLYFEDDKGERDPIPAGTLSALLLEHRIPAVVLNACQSAMVDSAAGDPFASVAAALLKAGTRSVVAMAYSLYVSGAQQFLPAFYGRLFQSGAMAEAARAGRQAMLANPKRVCARGKHPLQDWVVPVLYESNVDRLSFATGNAAPASKKAALPEGAREEDNPYGFVGRDGPILELERAMRGTAPAILIHGLGGVGKTTLARGFVEWLAATEGLGAGCLWVSFQGVRSAEYVFSQMGGALFGPQFGAASLEWKIDTLVAALREHRLVIVWDNFEVVAGTAGIRPALSDADRQALRGFLKGLRGGQSKVLITSRSEERWLEPDRRKVPLGGLGGEEIWEYCDAIERNHGIRIDRKDKTVKDLMDLLGGHPLMMRVVLSRLEHRTAAQLVTALRTRLDALGSGAQDEAQKKLEATLKLAEDAVPEDLRPLLVPIGMHERYLDGNFLEAMAKQGDGGWTRAQIDEVLQALEAVGLLRDLGQAICEMHPALGGFLRSKAGDAVQPEVREKWIRAFVGVMGSLADAAAPRELHEQRGVFLVHGANFYHALEQARRLGMQAPHAALTQALGAYALNTRDLAEAKARFEELAKVCTAKGDQKGEASALHQLGVVAQEQRDFAGAEGWYRKSLAIKEKQGNEHGAAITYHQLGVVAQGQRDFAGAEGWYRKSLAIEEKEGNEHGAALTYGQLGNLAHEQRDFAGAEGWFRKSLAIFEKQGNDHGAAITYHQLGILAGEQRDFAGAEEWYRKSLTIDEKEGNEHSAAQTYHQLGGVAAEQRDFAGAEGWFRKSLAIFEKQGNEHLAAQTYQGLGVVAEEQRDFAGAEGWFRKSLAIFEKQGNEHGAASTYHQLGILAGLQQHWEDAGRWLVRSIVALDRCNDPASAQQGVANLLIAYNRAPAAEQAKLRAIWQEAGLGEFPRDDGASTP